jgi:DNA-binding NtrC family response regulator
MNQILFVDDETNALQAYRRALRRTFQIDTAIGGCEALQAFRERGPYAVVVADVRMPEMSGIELLDRIRKEWPDTVRIVLTGNADRQTAVDAFECGQVFCFLSKPCSSQTLLESLQAGLARYSETLASSSPS